MASSERASVNTLGRLSEVLFEELERLNAVDVTNADALRCEVSRSHAIQGVAREINGAAATVLKSAEFRAEWAGARQASVPKMLEG